MSLLAINDDVLDLIVKCTVRQEQSGVATDIRQLLTLMGVCKSLRSFILQSPRLWRSLANFPTTMDKDGTMQLFKTLPAFESTVREIRFAESDCEVWPNVVSDILGHCTNLEILDISWSNITLKNLLSDLRNFSLPKPNKLKLKIFIFMFLKDIDKDPANPNIARFIQDIQRTLDTMSSRKVHLNPYNNCELFGHDWSIRMYCGDCSTELTTYCSSCDYMANDKLAFFGDCETCSKSLCYGCAARSCDRCLRNSCKNCDRNKTCYSCVEDICNDCGPANTCDVCERHVCNECGTLNFCENCKETHCDQCGKFDTCGVCGVLHCWNYECDRCESGMCRDCFGRDLIDEGMGIGCQRCLHREFRFCMACDTEDCKTYTSEETLVNHICKRCTAKTCDDNCTDWEDCSRFKGCPFLCGECGDHICKDCGYGGCESCDEVYCKTCREVGKCEVCDYGICSECLSLGCDECRYRRYKKKKNVEY